MTESAETAVIEIPRNHEITRSRVISGVQAQAPCLFVGAALPRIPCFFSLRPRFVVHFAFLLALLLSTASCGETSDPHFSVVVENRNPPIFNIDVQAIAVHENTPYFLDAAAARIMKIENTSLRTIYDFAGEQREILNDDESELTFFTFADTNTILLAGPQAKIVIFDIDNQKYRVIDHFPATNNAVACKNEGLQAFGIDRNNQRFFVACGNAIYRGDFRDGIENIDKRPVEKVAEMPLPRWQNFTFAPDGALLVCGEQSLNMLRDAALTRLTAENISEAETSTENIEVKNFYPLYLPDRITSHLRDKQWFVTYGNEFKEIIRIDFEDEKYDKGRVNTVKAVDVPKLIDFYVDKNAIFVLDNDNQILRHDDGKIEKLISESHDATITPYEDNAIFRPVAAASLSSDTEWVIREDTVSRVSLYASGKRKSILDMRKYGYVSTLFSDGQRHLYMIPRNDLFRALRIFTYDHIDVMSANYFFFVDYEVVDYEVGKIYKRSQANPGFHIASALDKDGNIYALTHDIAKTRHVWKIMANRFGSVNPDTEMQLSAKLPGEDYRLIAKGDSLYIADKKKIFVIDGGSLTEIFDYAHFPELKASEIISMVSAKDRLCVLDGEQLFCLKNHRIDTVVSRDNRVRIGNKIYRIGAGPKHRNALSLTSGHNLLIAVPSDHAVLLYSFDEE